MASPASVLRLLASVALLVALATACGGGGGEAKPSGIFYEMLKVVPDTQETRTYVAINDYAHIREQYSVAHPGPDAGGEELIDYLLKLGSRGTGTLLATTPLVASTFVGTAIPYAELVLPDRRRYLGFGFQDVDQDMEAGQPPEKYEAIRGSFDPSATERAISGCSECPPATRLTHEGVTIYSWGEDFATDFQRVLSPPAYDQVGRGGRIAVQERYVFRTIWTDGVRQMLDASQGKRTSLADIREFALMAGAMSEMGAYSVLMSDQVQRVDEAFLTSFIGTGTPEALGRLRVQLEAEPALGLYRTLAIGAGEDAKGQFMAIVLVYDDDAQAEADVPVFRRRIEEGMSMLTAQPWRELASVMEVTAVGRTLRAKLGGRLALHPYNFFFNRDPLLLQR